MHVHVPVREATYADTKGLARALARRLAGAHPELVVDRMPKALRAGRVLIGGGQNDPGKSTVAPWSARGLALPTVAVPVTWEEVSLVAGGNDPRVLVVTLRQALGRLERLGDLFAPVAGEGQRL